MNENFTKRINTFLSTLKTTYKQQDQTGKILFAILFVFLFCCICSVPVSVLRFGSRGASTPIPSPDIFPTSDGTQPTPTSLFDFDFPTLTPFPTLTFSVPTPFPTFTPSPTGSTTPSSLPPTATLTPLPTMTATQPPPTNPPATPTRVSSIHIITVNKAEEYVDIRNDTNAPVNLRGWKLVSELGNQSCALRGTLEPEEMLRIWARRGNPGFDCRLGSNVWSDNTPDPAVLYNPEGEEVSRFP